MVGSDVDVSRKQPKLAKARRLSFEEVSEKLYLRVGVSWAESSSECLFSSQKDQRQDSNNGSCECRVSSGQDPKSAAVAIHQRASGPRQVVRDYGADIGQATSGECTEGPLAVRSKASSQGRYRTYTLCLSQECCSDCACVVVVLRALCGLWSCSIGSLGG